MANDGCLAETKTFRKGRLQDTLDDDCQQGQHDNDQNFNQACKTKYLHLNILPISV